MVSYPHDTTPAWTWIVPGLAAILLALKVLGIAPQEWATVQILAALLLGASVFAAVHHAEVLALKLGEPFGSILLAVAVTVIEVGLIVAIFVSGAPGSEMVARDTVFSAVMIVLNGIVGLCLVLGAGRHHVQSFQLQGASAALNVLGPLAILTMVLPNFTEFDHRAVLFHVPVGLRRRLFPGALRDVRVHPDRAAPRLFSRQVAR